MKTYSGRACLSKEETIRGWKFERIDGLTRAVAALKLNVSEKTLYRVCIGVTDYRRQRGGNKYDESLSLL